MGKFFGLLAGWIGCSLCSLCFYSHDDVLDHDEIYWIGSAYYYDLAFVQRDWAHPAWTLLPARENPPVAKYVMGIGLAFGGYHITSLDGLSYFYLSWMRWENDLQARATDIDGRKREDVIEAATPGFRQWVLENRHAPFNRPVVEAARGTSRVCAALSSFALLLLVTMTHGRLVGLLASQLLLLHPAVRSAAGHAMSDAIALLFSTGAVFAVFWWSRLFSGSEAKDGIISRFGLSVVTGLGLGLACATKMNSLTVVMVFGAEVMRLLVNAASHDGSSAKRAVLGLVTQGLVVLTTALAVFIAINPAIWSDVWTGLSATILEHHRTEMLQMDVTRGRLVGLSAKLSSVVELAFGGWTIFAIVVAIIGWLAVRRGKDEFIRFALLWWLVTFVAVTAWMPFPWLRYVIPILPPSVWLAAVAVRNLCEDVRTVLRDQTRPNLTNRGAD